MLCWIPDRSHGASKTRVNALMATSGMTAESFSSLLEPAVWEHGADGMYLECEIAKYIDAQFVAERSRRGTDADQPPGLGPRLTVRSKLHQSAVIPWRDHV